MGKLREEQLPQGPAPGMLPAWAGGSGWDEPGQGWGTGSYCQKEGCDKAFVWNFMRNLEQNVYSQAKPVVGEHSQRCARWSKLPFSWNKGSARSERQLRWAMQQTGLSFGSVDK